MVQCATSASLSSAKPHYYWQSHRLVDNKPRYAYALSSLNTTNKRYKGLKKISSHKSCQFYIPANLNHKFRSTLCCCLGPFMEPQAIALAKWVPIGDQVLLMASVFLTYVAGVFPIKKNANVTGQNNIFTHKQEPEPLTSPSYGSKNSVDEGNPKDAWGIVRGKLLECLDAIELESNLGNKALELEQKQTKRPLSLYAVAEGPKLRLLWASFQQLEKEMNRITNDSMDVNNSLTVFCEIIRKSCQPICLAWLEKEVSLVNNNPNLSLISLVTEKLKGDDTILANIQKSGKENLYAEFLHFLCFGSLREGCCYEYNLFILHGDSILEDLVISLADGIASIYLELVSVDGNLSNEMNSLGFGICSLSTRALQRLRNEVSGPFVHCHQLFADVAEYLSITSLPRGTK